MTEPPRWQDMPTRTHAWTREPASPPPAQLQLVIADQIELLGDGTLIAYTEWEE